MVVFQIDWKCDVLLTDVVVCFRSTGNVMYWLVWVVVCFRSTGNVMYWLVWVAVCFRSTDLGGVECFWFVMLRLSSQPESVGGWREGERKIDRETDRQTDRQAGRHRQTDTGT